MRVIISAGGTGGHIYPAVAIINELKDRYSNLEIMYIGTHNRMEKDIIPKLGINYVPIKMFGISRKNPFLLIKTSFYFVKSIFKCRKIIKEFKPSIVIGAGGYVTAPVVYSANKLGVKTFIHEQNMKPGVANSFLNKYADVVGVTFESSVQYFNNAVVTGNPAGSEAVRIKPAVKSDYGLTEGKKLILVVMGSLGSSTINDEMIKAFKKIDEETEVLFVTGKDHYDEMKKNDFNDNIKVVSYIDGFPSVMKICDLIITRGGGSILAEITALGIPSIIVPSPYVANNEQYFNSLPLVSADAAIMIEEKDFDEITIIEKVNSLIRDEELLKIMGENSYNFGVRDSASLIVDKIEEEVNGIN